MNLISRLSLVLAICSVCSVAACGSPARAPAFSSVDDASWRPAEAAEMRFEPKVATASQVAHDDAPPVALKPNPRENLHGLLNTAH